MKYLRLNFTSRRQQYNETRCSRNHVPELARSHKKKIKNKKRKIKRIRDGGYTTKARTSRCYRNASAPLLSLGIVTEVAHRTTVMLMRWSGPQKTRVWRRYGRATIRNDIELVSGSIQNDTVNSIATRKRRDRWSSTASCRRSLGRIFRRRGTSNVSRTKYYYYRTRSVVPAATPVHRVVHPHCYTLFPGRAGGKEKRRPKDVHGGVRVPTSRAEIENDRVLGDGVLCVIVYDRTKRKHMFRCCRVTRARASGLLGEIAFSVISDHCDCAHIANNESKSDNTVREKIAP